MLRSSSVVLILVALAVAGCTPPEPKSYPIKGQVKLDGKPMKDGEIIFVGVGLTPQTLTVTDGAFSGMAREGKLRVEIYAYKQGPTVTMGSEKIEQPKVNYVAEKYNAKSELTADVTTAGPNEFKFEAESKKD